MRRLKVLLEPTVPGRLYLGQVGLILPVDTGYCELDAFHTFTAGQGLKDKSSEPGANEEE